MNDHKRTAQAAIGAQIPALVALSERIHAHPETGWNEHEAARWILAELAEHNFDITAGYLGLPTAFLASYGSGSIRIGVIAEYDALPGLGHACGHNLIAAIAVGAAVGLASVASELDVTVEVYGTPAEEGGGGKIELIDRGAFRGLDLAMMAHPAAVDVAEAEPFAVSHSHISFDGQAAHAAAFPERGVNANDAFVVAQVALGLLRQQLPSTVRVHGIMTVGGEAPNAIPEHTEGRWYVRATDLVELESVEERVFNCFRAGALATGCSLTIEPESKPYSNFTANQFALEAYRANAESLGRTFDASAAASAMNRASTDMGNVSQIVPAIHPYVGIGSAPATNHQKAFADSCVGPRANKALADAATALAWTAIDVAEATTR